MHSLNPSAFDGDSAELDRSLGFQVHAIEKELLMKALQADPEGNHHTWGAAIHGGNQSWVGLDPETLQTPYSELKLMCEHLRPQKGMRMVDLGAGYGRLGLVLSTFYPGVSFCGLELVKERVAEGNRLFRDLSISHSELYEQDLMSPEFTLPEADIYFIYDYGKVTHIRHTLNQLSLMAEKRNYKLVARGKGIRGLIDLEFPWLTIHPIIHGTNFSIYSTSM